MEECSAEIGETTVCILGAQLHFYCTLPRTPKQQNADENESNLAVSAAYSLILFYGPNNQLVDCDSTTCG